jgi:hypothetical protein
VPPGARLTDLTFTHHVSRGRPGPDPGSFHRSRGSCLGEKTNPRRQGERRPARRPRALLGFFVRQGKLIEVALHVLLDSGHDESPDPVGLDPEAIAGLDRGRGGNCTRDRHLVVL